MKPFREYQYLDGEPMSERDKKETRSKFWNKGKWNNFVAPFLPKDCGEMTLIEMGCNAGLFLKLAEEKGFGQVVGVDADEEAIRRGLAWRDKNGNKYQIIHSHMEKCIDSLPLADYTVLVNSHYYFLINDWLDYMDKLQSKTVFCIIVTAEKRYRRICCASADFTDIRSYFKNWDEVGFIDELPLEGDPSPRRLWGLCFKSRTLERVPIESLIYKNHEQDKFYEELDRGIGYKNTHYYKFLKDYRKWWSEDRLNKWMLEKIAAYENVKKNRLTKPIIINSDKIILDGNHKYAMMKHLGFKSILVRKT
ncbi:MAG: hypothetical protein UT61_C0050G0005 [Candidatus Woesebacteria bacterium GW2011_GWA1_39_8]|uniref:Methyltransferase domain-containing protein n=1 Tax=Candidatus Woesebacteria bacterium GW2011_GWA1_39_8 TaxID=1618552 RepID=A0A0G0PTK0_9BACT|nr:MAG: hypothetical protein UT61_C0050G0005 [Candidatus Woesebacteria bacterium GW2011_GWA1_39_8]